MSSLEIRIVNALIDLVETMIPGELIRTSEGDHVFNLHAQQQRKRLAKLRKMMEKIS